MTTVSLVTLEQAKSHLNMDHSSSDADIQLKIEQASDIILDYLEESDGATWLTETGDSPPGIGVPPLIQAATLLIVGELFAKREAGSGNFLSPAVKDLLRRYREAVMA